MVSSISSTSSSLYTSSTSSSSTLTDDLKKKLDDILSNYDSSNLTADSTKSLMDALKSSGVQPSKAVKDYLSSKGFDIKPPQGPPPPDSLSGLSSTSLSSSSSSSSTSSSSGSNSTSSLPGYLQDFITKEEAGTVTQDDINSLISSLQNSGQNTTGVLIDQTT
ncbi:MAG: hypothetical protein P4L45_13485 [Ignavibacteriaceae bacterium]|nr:hypothetical protein [Ignavibacteriaceae bacterium]